MHYISEHISTTNICLVFNSGHIPLQRVPPPPSDCQTTVIDEKYILKEEYGVIHTKIHQDWWSSKVVPVEITSWNHCPHLSFCIYTQWMPHCRHQPLIRWAWWCQGSGSSSLLHSWRRSIGIISFEKFWGQKKSLHDQLEMTCCFWVF